MVSKGALNQQLFSPASFYKSSSNFEECPDDGKPEFAFIGRSNVGKSSLINALTKQKELAKTSSKPGKTKLINHFLIEESWYLVDLPGYGYAQVSKKERSQWEQMTEAYLKNRQQLVCLFILVDSRIPPQKIDLNFINQMGEWGVPFQIVFTKCDKVKKSQRIGVLNNLQTQLAENWEILPEIQFTSGQSGLGLEQFAENIWFMLGQLNH